MNKLTLLKNELKRDIINNHGSITRGILMTLLATNKTLRDRQEVDHKKLDYLDKAILLIWEETFNSEIEVFSNF